MSEVTFLILDIAKDTSDTSSKSGSSGSDYGSLLGLEFEPMSLSEQEQELSFDSRSSGADSVKWNSFLHFIQHAIHYILKT